MSGMNFPILDQYFDLGGKTPNEAKRFLREYCNHHPLANYYDAVLGLLVSLPKVKIPKSPN
jgi:hypothetical protein